MQTKGMGAALAAAFGLLLAAGSPANAATGSDLIDAVHAFVQTGVANADTSFVELRGEPIKETPGEHYRVKSTFGEFLPDCHVSGYRPPQAPNALWVLSCSSPGLGADPRVLKNLVYEGVLHGLPACFTRTLNPAVLGDETFRWDCRGGAHSLSVDVTGSPASNGDTTFLIEVYEYLTPLPNWQIGAAPSAPTPAPVTVHLQKPTSSLTMGGVEVPYSDYATLALAVAAAQHGAPSAAFPHVSETLKGGQDMPAYDVFWHYAGMQGAGDKKVMSVWICGNLSPQEQTMALNEATLMGLLDAGLGGAVLQKAYADAKTADAALGPAADDPFENRRKLVMSMAPYFR